MTILPAYLPDSNNLAALADIVGEDAVSVSAPVRIEYARDCHAINILQTCEGTVPHPPDFVVWPQNEEQVARLVAFARAGRTPLIPFGAGSGVCRGTEPIRGGIVMDLKRMNRILELDEVSCLVRVQSGMMGETFERELNHRGYTAGHFPSSIYCSTVGGWVAARSAGQLSTKYGKIEDMIHAMTVVLPDGRILRTRGVPASSAGPSWDQVFTGSEGTLGVITDATLKIHRYPEARQFLSFNFPDVKVGTNAIRRVLRQGVRPAAVRLYDELDTVLVGKSGKSGGGIADYMPTRELNRFLRAMLPRARKNTSRLVMSQASLINLLPKLVNEGCLCVMTFEGDPRIVQAEYDIARGICESEDGRNLGPDPAKHWWDNRYHVSFKQSKVFDAGAFVDTIEVATTWDRLMKLYDLVKAAISPLAFIMAHFSHAYTDGCSIYFTFVTSAKDARAAKGVHHKVWAAAMSACDEAGATISHHHGIGLSKAEWMEQELGQAGGVFQSLKKIIDPSGFCNPGKLGY